MLTFHSPTVHKALPNGVPGKIRLSCDFRYQPATEPIVLADGSLDPHRASAFGYTWVDVYDGWTRTDLQYCWKKHAFELLRFDRSLFDPKEKIC